MAKRLFSFFLLSLALGIAPGPDIIFVFAQSLVHGWRAGSLVTLGLCTGLVFHVSLAAFGIAAILSRYPRAFRIITYLGAAYLVFLGFGAWRGAGEITVSADGVAASEKALGALALYGRGVIMNVCNPKVMLFFLALMPRFVEPDRGKVVFQFLLLGAVFAIATLIVFNLVAFGGGAISRFLADQPESMAVLERFAAIVMFALAAWIVWMNRLSLSERR